LRLKNLPRPAPGATPERQGAVREKSWVEGRRHVLWRSERGGPGPGLAELELDGARAVEYVPDEAYILAVGPEFTPARRAALRMETIPARLKVSRALRRDEAQERQTVVVEFHPDVEPEVIRSIAAVEGFRVLEHPDLLPNHLLIEGPSGSIDSLVEWDEVAYVFPASAELEENQRVVACPGAMTAQGTVGQYVASVGDGWDGPGLGSAELGYFFQQLTGKLPADLTRSEIERALNEWAKYASLSFFPASSATSLRALNFLFASGNHGDGYPFDGRGKVLAHTFYPSPPNPEPIAGDVHLDNDEEWVMGPDISTRSVDLFSVVLHELGHALGLGHSDVPGSVMYPYYRRHTSLTPVDTGAIQTLYAPAGSPGTPEAPSPAPLALTITQPAVLPATTTASSLSIAGTVTGGSNDVWVRWQSDRTGAGLASGGRSWIINSLPLATGLNNIQLTATDSTGAQATRSFSVTRVAETEKLEIRILSPTASGSFATSSPSITVSGTASPAASVTQVRWQSSSGATGVAQGTSAWSAGPIALKPGSNTITVTAIGASGSSASASLAVVYSSVTDTTPPQLRITYPASTNVLTTAASIRLQGTASDNVGLAEVSWTSSSGAAGVATGLTSWSTAAIPLLRGTNILVVTARDLAGNSTWRSITVTRR